MKIEQKKHTPFELIENENGDLGIKTVIAEFTLEKDLRTTVAKSIDERYQKIEDLLERGRVLLHSCTFDDPFISEAAKKDINDFYSEIEALNQAT